MRAEIVSVTDIKAHIRILSLGLIKHFYNLRLSID